MAFVVFVGSYAGDGDNSCLDLCLDGGLHGSF